MKRSAVLTVLAIGLVGCTFAAPEDAYSVQDVIADISSEGSKLDGETVAIHGWLDRCAGRQCYLYSLDGPVENGLKGDPRPDGEQFPDDRVLRIGWNEEFDQTAWFFQYSEVVVVGEVNATWRQPEDEEGINVMCLGRCNDINPISIEKVIL